MVLSTAWFPPVDYFALLAESGSVYLEACESYRKQTWRNRCRILTANGPMDLRVPVVHDGTRLVRDIRIDWSTPWLRQCEYAIDSAYYGSPFFVYYRDELFGLLDRQPETLWEMNLGVIDFFCRKIGIAPQILPTEDFELHPEGDCRELFSPKRPCASAVRPYWQVFREKFGFVPGLSVMDLLFNEGPESLSYLIPARSSGR